MVGQGKYHLHSLHLRLSEGMIFVVAFQYQYKSAIISFRAK